MGEWGRKGFELQRVHRHLHVKKTLVDDLAKLKNQDRSFFGGWGEFYSISKSARIFSESLQ